MISEDNVMENNNLEGSISKEKIRFESFTQEETDILDLFHTQIKEIKCSRIIKNNLLKYSINFKAEKEKGGYLKSEFPDEDDLRSLLVLIRPLTLPKERIYFKKIINLLIKKCKNDDCKRFFETFLGNYKKQTIEDSINIVINGRSYPKEKIFKLWINGYYFHKDKEKIKKLKKFGYLSDFSKGQLIEMTIIHLNYFVYLDEILVAIGLF